MSYAAFSPARSLDASSTKSRSYRISASNPVLILLLLFIWVITGIQSELNASDGLLVPADAHKFSRYYGGEGSEYTRAVDVDAAGNIYVIAQSNSPDLATPGSFVQENGSRTELKSYPYCTDCTDSDPGVQVERVVIQAPNSILITKFSPDGTDVIWSTYFNLPNNWSNLGINSAAVSDSGEVSFGISDAPPGLPLVNAIHTHSITQSNAYIAKLNTDGSGLIFATYLNVGNAIFALRGLDVSADGKVAVTGSVGTENTLPEINSIEGQSCTLNASLSEWYDGYIALFDHSGDLVFSSCLGGEIRDGSSSESLRGVAFGQNGHLYAVGYSAMTDFPLVDPIQASKNIAGDREMTISQIDPVTGSLVFSTWFGTEQVGHPPKAAYDYESFSSFSELFPSDIKADPDGNIIVTGTVDSLHYPTVNAVQTNMAVPGESTDFFNPLFNSEGLDDQFVTRLHPVDGVKFSTYLGGSRSEPSIPVLALDAGNNIYVLGVSASDDFPLQNAIQVTKTADASITLSKLTPEGALAFSTYLGGEGGIASNSPGGVAINASGQIIVGSTTDSPDFSVVGSGTELAGKHDITLSIIDHSDFTDGDGDGVPDAVDAFPGDADEWRDTDGDLTGDAEDTDDDGDGEPDATDRFPQDASEIVDADGDGAGDNLDEFDDDLANYFDLDTDGLADYDAAETDRDGDGTENSEDAFDYDASETSDLDGDRIGDNTDDDLDGDLVPDAKDRDRLDFDIPLFTFERYDPFNTAIFKSPWPCGFEDVEGTDQSWTQATDEALSGTNSLASRIIEDGQVAAIQYTGTFVEGHVEFWHKVSSQEGADIFTFSVDSDVQLTLSGESDWTQFSMPVEAGEHVLEWRYAKDEALTEGADAAWIDDFEIIGRTIFVDNFEPRVHCSRR